MKKPKNTQPKVASPITQAMIQRGGSGIHADQRRKADPKAIRRDKSYKDFR